MSGFWLKLRAALGGLVIVLMALLSANAESIAATDSQGVVLTKIETYLNTLGTLQSDFIQVASDGSYAQGKLVMAKPGKMRMEYHPPVPIVLIADGVFLIYIDTELNQISHIPLVLTPAAALLDDNLSFENPDLTVSDFKHANGLISVTVTQSSDPDEGALTLTFTDAPFQLRKWRVVDSQGVTTDVTLLDPRTGMDVDPRLFDAPVVESNQNDR